MRALETVDYGLFLNLDLQPHAVIPFNSSLQSLLIMQTLLSLPQRLINLGFQRKNGWMFNNWFPIYAHEERRLSVGEEHPEGRRDWNATDSAIAICRSISVNTQAEEYGGCSFQWWLWRIAPKVAH